MTGVMKTWYTFRKYGRVLDIYNPLTKLKSRKRFSFVRFLTVKDEVVLERQLDQITVGASKLWVNKPRFKKEEERSRVVKRPVEKNHVKPRRSYAEVVKGNHGMIANKMIQPQSVMDVGSDQNMQQKGDWPKATSRIWKVKNDDCVSDGLEFTTKEEDFLWLKGCYVGTLYSMEMILTLQEKFFMEGYFSCKVRPMGGRLVLLEGSDQDEIKDLAEIAMDWLGQWFEDVKPWDPTMVARESKKKRFDIGRILISTPVMSFITKSMKIKVNGEPDVIKVMEEKATNGIFSMKSDHVFKELSASDEFSSESWSLHSEIEGACGESVHGGSWVGGKWKDTVIPKDFLLKT
ncbi:hypothetical protein SLEP1_g49142 [Rubroshorea leprosula]|uniref:Uncharacterized protein n=1 Tax=Rubroshorea leprosula TaxID=152421 RepID=A0AAV5LZ31_9ROSI|nr:hypothetical protein SLEP1_g49142 [Rubroshorea leprosula]